MNTHGPLQRSRRIAVVAACPFPAPRGSQVLVASVVEQLLATGNQVHQFTYPGAPEGPARPGLVRHRARLGRRGDPLRLGWHKARLDIGLLWVLWRVLAKERIDIVHAHNYEAPLLAYLVRWWTGVPVLYHAHNALADELACYVPPGWRRRLAVRLGGWLDRQIPRRADAVIALTQELAGYLEECGVGRDRLRVLPPAALPGLAVAMEPVPATAAGEFVVAYAGNLDGYQDLGVLSDAFARLRDTVPAAVLELVTHEPEWAGRVDERLHSWVCQGAARVFVADGFVSAQRRLAAASVLVCPRVSWSGYPIKLLNYRATGRPIVAARGSAKELRHEQTALIIADGDPVALAAALARLYAEPQLAHDLGRAARREAEEWAERGGFASQLEEIYSKIEARPTALRLGGLRALARLLARVGERISAMAPNGGAR